eukprot:scaffold62346_cov21-Tisochrysis_lutea.AAC.1
MEDEDALGQATCFVSVMGLDVRQISLLPACKQCLSRLRGHTDSCVVLFPNGQAGEKTVKAWGYK